jgi:hypothetical protein
MQKDEDQFDVITTRTQNVANRHIMVMTDILRISSKAEHKFLQENSHATTVINLKCASMITRHLIRTKVNTPCSYPVYLFCTCYNNLGTTGVIACFLIIYLFSGHIPSGTILSNIRYVNYGPYVDMQPSIQFPTLDLYLYTFLICKPNANNCHFN